MNRVLVFDVETTGLVNPYITQITIITYDVKKRQIIRCYNSYIQIPDHIEITAQITEITGITREICDTKGVSIVEALLVFYQEYHAADYIVAHNISFDMKVIYGEFKRNKYDIRDSCPFWMYLFKTKIIDKNERRQIYCTMKQGRDLCKIVMTNKNGARYTKMPKLIELFQNLFCGEPDPINLHNSLYDTLICLRCFIMMIWYVDIEKSATSRYNSLYAGTKHATTT
jgi:DNA polymerase III epsilon subunit-like protein